MADTAAQSEVTAVVWKWQDKGVQEAVDPRPPVKSVLIEAAVAACAGLILLLLFRKRIPGIIVLCIAVTILAGGLFVPPLYNGLKKGAAWLGKAAGIALSWLLLAPFFYTCFTFARLMLVLTRKDPMHREFPGHEKSYWFEHKPPPDLERYRKQH